jgi:hypothetical protein
MSCKKCKTSKCSCETTICTNPLIYAMKSVFSLVDGNANLPTVLSDVLTGGISISNNKNLCCPDCKNGIYFLGGAENFINLYNTTTTRICCLEHASAVETRLTVIEATGNKYGCCNTDFNEAFQQWFDASSSSSANFYLDDLVELGILESSSFNGYSGLGILFNYLQLNHPELTPENYLNILSVIVNLGLVIQCNGCEIVIASVDTYLTWVEAIGGGGGVPA